MIQKHAASHLHYDFRLEMQGTLLSWALPKGPCLDPHVKRLAVHVEDHPVSYGSFEGTIPKGQYGGGTVMLWDRGEWMPKDANPLVAYKKGSLHFQLKAKKLKGEWHLVRMNNNDKTWLLIKSQDAYARTLKEKDILSEKPHSILNGKTMAEIGGKPNLPAKKSKKTTLSRGVSASLPSRIFPQRATLVSVPPEGSEWLHEIKFDGYRIVAFKKGKTVRLMTRNQQDWTKKFPSVCEAIKKLSVENAIFDGEIILQDENGRSSFQALQNSLKEGKTSAYVYCLFDLLYMNNRLLTAEPLSARKKTLQAILAKKTANVLFYSSHITGNGKDILAAACQLSLEGIVSKQAESTYQEKRTRTWVKAKCQKRQEFVIVGYKAPRGKRQFFGALLLASRDKNTWLFHGSVGTGFTESSLAEIHKKMLPLVTKTSPFSHRVPGLARITWIKPVLVAEVAFSEWTRDNRLRHPVFCGLREDKPAKLIKQEKEKSVSGRVLGTAAIQLTHPEKILYPEGKITKQALAEYYAGITPWMFAYVRERPLTLVRCPENYHHCFYQKHATHALRGVKKILLPEKGEKGEKGKTSEYFFLTHPEGLVALANLGVLEVHPWGSVASDPEHPDLLVLDIDPAPGVTWKRVVQAARAIRKRLKGVGLKSFVKGTGGKGLHVVVPLKPSADWGTLKQFARAFVHSMCLECPDKYTETASKEARKGKIFLDYLRNSRGATAIAPFSPRARKHAPVALPLAWTELGTRLQDNFYTIRTLPQRLKRLKHDPWKDFFSLRQSLPQ